MDATRIRSSREVKSKGGTVTPMPYTYVCRSCQKIQRTHNAEYKGVIDNHHVTHVTCPSCGYFQVNKEVEAIAYFCYGVRD